ncbi:MAG TPA: arabinan endo-1,5-alpha-L-arabinosidase [Tepidisphaeraceae bacterium]|nr:arabinan endo-1,5-alpha-L-arabinosidase [Tepidisphaeraceae bacterium]
MLSRKRLVILLMAILSMRASAQTTAPALTPQQQWWELQRQPAGPQAVVRVHDPCAIFANNAYYLFCTGRGTPMFRSDDRYHWTRVGVVFPQQPDWALREVPGSRGQWAPDISLFNGVYHLYYAVSTFGSRRSCIGLTINKTLDVNSPDFRWIDQGKVIETHNSDNYNAIDPNLVMDEHDQPWMVFGSCWDGVRISRLDVATGKPPSDEPPPRPLEHRPKGKLFEGPFVVRHGEWFYLFISFDACCRGAQSTYNIRVGRSRHVDGPYVDMDGVPMLEGGGTLVLGSYGSVRGPGHCGVMTDAAGRQWMVHHFYDADDRGISKLQVRRIVWSKDEWPLVGEPVDRPVSGQVNRKDVAGFWKYSVNFGDDRPVRLKADGSSDAPDVISSWRIEDGRLALNVPTGRAMCEIADDGEWFVGRDQSGVILRGHRSRN